MEKLVHINTKSALFRGIQCNNISLNLFLFCSFSYVFIFVTIQASHQCTICKETIMSMAKSDSNKKDTYRHHYITKHHEEDMPKELHRRTIPGMDMNDLCAFVAA